MPCVVYDPDLKDRSDEIAELKKEVNTVTRLLCRLCRSLPAQYLNDDKELLEWYKEHKKVDRERYIKVNVKHYTSLHPSMTAEEVVSLVDRGILPDMDKE